MLVHINIGTRFRFEALWIVCCFLHEHNSSGSKSFSYNSAIYTIQISTRGQFLVFRGYTIEVTHTPQTHVYMMSHHKSATLSLMCTWFCPYTLQHGGVNGEVMMVITSKEWQ